MNKGPLVSILLPCYNVAEFVEEAMDSLLAQTYTNFEIIAINDCSTDATKEILNELANKDSRIKVFENETNLKLIKTLNKGIALCNGIYIARMDADDIALPKRIEKEVLFLENNKDHDVVSSHFEVFVTGSSKRTLHKNPITHDELQAYLLFKSGICHPACMIRKTLFTDLGLSFEPEYLHVEDYALWSRALYKTKLGNVDEPLLLYRVHANQVSTLHDSLQLENKKKVFKIHAEQLNLGTSADDLEVYTSVAESIPIYSSIEFIKKCEVFMLSLIEKNIETPFCSHVFLCKMLSLHWLRLCANSRLGFKVYKQCVSSFLYKTDNYSKRDICIFHVKCLFKLKYKQSFLHKLMFVND